MSSSRLYPWLALFALFILLTALVFVQAPILAHPPFDATPVPADFKDPVVLSKGACAQDPRNLVTNGSMGPPVHNTKYGVVVNGWEPVIFSGTSAPDFRWVDNEQIDPNGSQQIYFSQTFDAGLYQTVRNLTPGVTYWFRVGYFVAAKSIDGPNVDTDTMVRQIGVDPTGGTDPNSKNIIWNQPLVPYKRVALNHLNMILVFPARSTSATFYIRAIANDETMGENRVWIDAICMEARTDVTPVVGPGMSTTPPPTLSPSVSRTVPPTSTTVPTSTPTSTSTFTPTPTSTPTNTPTMTATNTPVSTRTSTPTPSVPIIGGGGFLVTISNISFLVVGILIGIVISLATQSLRREYRLTMRTRARMRVRAPHNPAVPKTSGATLSKSVSPIVGIGLFFGIILVLGLCVGLLSLLGMENTRKLTQTVEPSASPTEPVAQFVPSTTPTPTLVATMAPTVTRTTVATTETIKPIATIPPTLVRTTGPTSKPTVNPTLPPVTVNPTLPPATINATLSPFPKQTYSTLPILSRATDRPAAQHADLNFGLRGYVATKAALQLVDLEGSADAGAPNLPDLFSDHRAPTIKAAYRVNDWDWNCNCRSDALNEPEVTLLGIAATPGELLLTPAGADIGNGNQAMVLYADATRLTLVYTRNDNVTKGYTIHLEDVAVSSDLVALYKQSNDAGRASLPVLRAGQPIAQARTTEVKVAIRDAGTFMDPRSRKDWWQGK